MALSERALSMLSNMARVDAASTADLRDSLERLEAPVFESWIDFHSRYAGYVEQIGHDRATWGIVHSSPEWLAPHEAEVDIEDGMVVCADVHPSYWSDDFQLTSTGEYIGGVMGPGLCASFDVRLEQMALVWSLSREEPWDWLHDARNWTAEEKNRLLAFLLTGGGPIAEASDKYTTTWCHGDWVVLQRAERWSVARRRAATPNPGQR